MNVSTRLARCEFENIQVMSLHERLPIRFVRCKKFLVNHLALVNDERFKDQIIKVCDFPRIWDLLSVAKKKSMTGK